MKSIYVNSGKICLSAALSCLAILFMMTSCGKNRNNYDASGIFEATEVVVSAKVQGEILSLLHDEGDDVAQGSELGTIDIRQLSLKRLQLEQTRQSTDNRILDIPTQISSLKQQTANLQKEKTRFEALLKDNAATQKQVDDIDYQINVYQKQIAALNEQLLGANRSLEDQSSAVEAQISQIDEQIKDATITSPLTGTVIQRYCEQGEYATPGKPLFKIANLDDMKLRAYITASQYETLKLGDQVQVYIDGKAEAYQGTVSWISPKAEFTPKTIQTKDERANLVYAVKIDVRNDGYIKIGMYGDILFAK